MNIIKTLAALAATALLLAGLAGCSDDDNPASPGDGGQQGTTFTLTIANVSGSGEFFAAGTFAVPEGMSDPSPIGPGQAYEFSVGAEPGSRLSFATMFVHSNDLFYAPAGEGIALYNTDGSPRTGDVTSEVMLWDAGTEQNEQPGAGPNQPPSQSGPDSGPTDPDMNVRLVDDGFSYPAAGQVIRVTLAADGHGLTTVRIENVSDTMTLDTGGGMTDAVPLAPGVFVVHRDPDPLFTSGMKAMTTGLEALAEDGNPDPLGSYLTANTGQVVPLAPGIAAVHESGAMLFSPGAPAVAGLEDLAEDGDPAGLAAAFGDRDDVSSAAVFSIPDGATDPMPIGPGQSYTVSFTAEQGDRLALATMFVQSNDLFYAFDPEGYALFSGSGAAQAGDLTGMIRLWDAGTEINQWPGAGPDQAPRQAGPDAGADDPHATVRLVDDGFPYPPADQVLSVTLSVQP